MMKKTNCDLAIIGAGPGGYVAALRGALRGLKVVLIDKRAAAGGACLFEGCIPSKALLHSSMLFAGLKDGQYEDHGIMGAQPQLDLAAMMQRKDKIVEKLQKGVAFLLKKKQVTFLQGRAHFKDEKTIIIEDEAGGSQSLSFHHAIIATGSESVNLRNVTCDGERVMDSTSALSLKEVPSRMVVVGAGFIGLELGSVWHRLGAKVTVLDMESRIALGMDKELSDALKTCLEKQGLQFELGVTVKTIVTGKKDVTIKAEYVTGGKEFSLTAECLLQAVGRRPYSQNLGLENTPIETDERGFIRTMDGFRTHLENVYAIGDVRGGGALLAHKATEEAVMCVDIITGKAKKTPLLIPSVLYTEPEAASVGFDEATLQERNIEYKKGIFPFSSLGRSLANGHEEGFVKLLAHRKNDALLGIHCLGQDAGTLIGEAAALLAMGGTSDDLAHICHAHPTTSEALKEAALVARGEALHQPS